MTIDITLAVGIFCLVSSIILSQKIFEDVIPKERRIRIEVVRYPEVRVRQEPSYTVVVSKDDKNKKSTPLYARCAFCNKEVIMPYRCKYCGRIFCADHRLPENHECDGIGRCYGG